MGRDYVVGEEGKLWGLCWSGMQIMGAIKLPKLIPSVPYISSGKMNLGWNYKCLNVGLCINEKFLLVKVKIINKLIGVGNCSQLEGWILF